MKAEIDKQGILHIIPENETESYALRKWATDLFNQHGDLPIIVHSNVDSHPEGPLDNIKSIEFEPGKVLHFLKSPFKPSPEPNATDTPNLHSITITNLKPEQIDPINDYLDLHHRSYPQMYWKLNNQKK